MAVAGLGTLLLTGTANAASQDTEVYSDDDNPGGMAWLKAEGEHFGVCDRQNDSLGVRGKLTWTDSAGSHERKQVCLQTAKGATMQFCDTDTGYA
ncbi:MAG: hypothetical protein QOI78_511 [Actinomycetota bacterium]|nr:hypothetical protein [Actinomycetota bacterium]